MIGISHLEDWRKPASLTAFPDLRLRSWDGRSTLVPTGMHDDQLDIEVNGDVLARLGRRGHGYVLFALDPRLRAIDEKVFASVGAAREAVLITLDNFARETD